MPIIRAIIVTGMMSAKADKQLDFALIRELVDQPVGQFGQLRLHLLDMAGHEGAVDERPEACVLRRLQLKQRIALGEIEVGDMLVRLGSRALRGWRYAGSAGRSGGRAKARSHGRSR
jgi:hypothetical protein